MSRRYPLLGNKKFLYQKYHVEKLSAPKIAEIIGCDPHSVWLSLKSFNIKRRTYSEMNKGETHHNYGKYKHARLQNKEWLYEQYIEIGLNIAQIARIVGCSTRCIRDALHRFHIPLRGPSEAPNLRYSILRNKSWLEEKYITDGNTVQEIAAIVGCSGTTVLSSLNRHEIKMRKASETKKRKRSAEGGEKILLLDDEKWLEGKYLGEKLSCTEIASIIGCERNAPLSALRRFNIPRRKPSEYKTREIKELEDKEWLKERYIVEKLGQREISKILRCAVDRVRRAMESHGIAVRTRSEINISRTLTTQTKQKISDAKIEYKILYNKEWLIEQYVTKKLSVWKIAEIVGCCGQTVANALKSLNIPRTLRSSEEVRQKVRGARKLQILPTHHTKPELIFEEMCKKYNLPFRYTGDSAFWIGKKGEKQLNPDFIESNGKKIAVEVFGDYWHSPLLNFKLEERSTLHHRKKALKKYGWKLIVLWEADLKREDAEQFVLSVLKKYKAI